MGMLTPWFLGGLLALGVPIVIHLINRERKTVVEFPSLMFLQKVTYKSVRQQKIRHLLLFILRCLALILLVAAFARPFMERKRSSGAALTGAREIVVLIDQSYSMGFGDRWKRAQEAAKKAVSDLGSRDRGSVILFANDAMAATEPTAAHDRLNRAIDAAKVSDEGTKYGPALKLASQLLEASNLPRREVVLISDFQTVGRPRTDDLRLPVGTKLTPIDLSKGETPDVAVASVTTDRDKESEQDRVTVAARLTNTGKAPRTLDAVLELGGRVVQTRRVTVPASSAAQVRFTPVAIASGATRGAVKLPVDSLSANDAFHFTLAPDAAVSVLVVEPQRARANQSLFLSRALAIGDRPTFKVDVKSIELVTPADFADRSLIVLNEVAPPNGAAGARLREAVTSGAGLILVPADARTENWGKEWQPLLPARFGPVSDRTSGGGGTLASVDYAHPIFESFSAPRSGDFSTSHVYRYRGATSATGASVIARFDDGAPALIEQPLGTGKILLWTSSLDEYWTDLPLQPVFLPFVHELAKYAGRFSDARASFTAGTPLDLSRHGELTAMFQVAGAADKGDVALILESPSGKKTRMHALGADHIAELRERGFYELRGLNTPAGSGRPIAVNVDIAESDLSHFEPQELVAMVTGAALATEGTTGATVEAKEALERRQTIWWYLLIVALLILAAETMLSNRLSRASA